MGARSREHERADDKYDRPEYHRQPRADSIGNRASDTGEERDEQDHRHECQARMERTVPLELLQVEHGEEHDAVEGKVEEQRREVCAGHQRHAEDIEWNERILRALFKYKERDEYRGASDDAPDDRRRAPPRGRYA